MIQVKTSNLNYVARRHENRCSANLDRRDTGGPSGRGKETPILIADGEFDPRHIVSIFERESELVSVQCHSFVVSKLHELVEAR